MIAFTVLVAVLLYAVVGRFLLSYLPDYRTQLESYLTEELGVTVEVGQLTASWDGFDPILQVRNISINRAHNAHIKAAEIKFAFLNSVIARAPRIRSVTLDSVNVAMQQTDDGDWIVADFDLSKWQPETSGDQSYALEDVLDGANLLLLDAFVRVQSQREAERVWRMPSVSLNYLGSRIYARGNIIEPDGLQPLLRFVYNSDPLEAGVSARGQLFIEARSTNVFDNILKTYSWQGISLQTLDANGRVWIDLNGLQVASIFVELQAHKLHWNLHEKPLPPMVNSTLRMAWRGNEHGQRVDLYDFDVRWKEKECRISSAVYESSGAQHDLGFSDLDLSCVSDFLVSLGLVEGRLAERLHAMRPQGHLKNIELGLNTADGDVQQLNLTTNLDNVALQAFDGAPALSGVNGYLSTDLRGGSVRIDSEGMGLAFPELYLKGWKAQRASGEVRWDLGGEDVVISSHDLVLDLGHNSSVFGDFLLRLNDDLHEDYLGLMLGLRNIRFDDVDLFVPYYVVPEDLYDWLSHSLVDGVVEDGLFAAYGSVESNSADNSFSSSLIVNTRDGVLEFDQDWPRVSGLDLSISLHEDRLEISGKDAVIAEMPIHQLDVVLPGSIGKPTTENVSSGSLEVGVDFSANSKNYEFWLGESALAETLSGLHDAVIFEGASRGHLGLDIDFDNDLEIAYQLGIDAQGLSATIHNTGLKFDDIHGKVTISSDSGVSAEALSLTAFGNPAYAQIIDISKDNPLSSIVPESTQIAMSGIASMKAVQQLHGAKWDYGLAGEADFQAELNIPHNDNAPPELTVRSSLARIESKWPAPLDKAAGKPVTLKSKAVFNHGQTELGLELAGSAFPSLNGRLLIVDDALDIGRISLNTGSDSSALPALATTQGVSIQANVDTINVDAWVDFVNDYIPESDDPNQVLVNQIAIRAGQAEAYGTRAMNVQALIKTADAKIDLSGDNVVGEILLPTEERRLKLDLERLKIETIESGTDGGASDSPLDPREFISLDFSSQDTVIDSVNWGQWSFFTESDDYGLLFRNIRGQVHGAQFDGQLNWQYFDGHYHTILTMSGQGKDAAPVLGLFGQESPLSSESFTADLALVWPDQPMNFSLARLSGSASLSFDEGLIKTDSNATGVLRMFGIFNADAIGRRLRLDFSDLYKNGISYDEVRLNAAIDQGSMSFADPLIIKGPSSNYEISGNVDLTEQQLDLKMLLQLPLASNVPLAGLVLGAPVVGGAVWLVDKILGEPLSRISTVRYSISGDWNDPEMKLEKAINAR